MTQPDETDKSVEFALWTRERLVEEVEVLRNIIAVMQEGPVAAAVQVEGIVAARNQQPFIFLTVDGKKAQLTIPKAKEVAYWLLRAATSAEADAFLVQFFSNEIGPMDPRQMWALITKFREFCKANAVAQAKED